MGGIRNSEFRGLILQLQAFYLFERNSPNFFKTDAVLSAQEESAGFFKRPLAVLEAGTSFSIAKKKQNAIQELRP